MNETDYPYAKFYREQTAREFMRKVRNFCAVASVIVLIVLIASYNWSQG